MECKFEIDVNKPRMSDIILRPTVAFKLVQCNRTPFCMNSKEIDTQINYLIRGVKKLGKQAKTKLAKAISEHDSILEKKRAEYQS
ncbi:hypothetical protein [uncultured Desulfosarcina sp.]|uniref:hypothetical protein n=1 Tax=uncultured Desulfosarcina sp. TaxID=218289 RepID=UPI0029C7CEE0|nr:hypothetical protein [uncultured Desulfosarcina sp.]